jgi:hypothetical protein
MQYTMEIDILKKTIPAIAFLMLSNAANSATLLPSNDKGYDGATLKSAGYEQPTQRKFEGLNYSEPLTKIIGERLYKARSIETKEVAKFKIDAPLNIYGKAPLFGKKNIIIPAVNIIQLSESNIQFMVIYISCRILTH